MDAEVNVPEMVNESTQKESNEGERRINYGRFALVLSFLLINILNRIYQGEVVQEAFIASTILTVIVVGVSLAIHFILRREKYYSWLKYVIISLDFLAVTVMGLILSFIKDPFFQGIIV